MSDPIPPEEHRAQVERYQAVRDTWIAFASALEAALRRACSVWIPTAVVQSRAKTVGSFAEKCARKWAKYRDPVHQLTDLCGARVIVHTLDQVEAVCRFVERNFAVREREDKTQGLGEDRFGYRDIHYVVALDPARAERAGFTAAQVALFGSRPAELQVRTAVQHAWADVMHDRLYRAPIGVSSEARRTGNRLSALMETGDREFTALAAALDTAFANYAAHADAARVRAEVEVLSLVLAAEPDATARARVATTLARLLGACGEHARVVALMGPLVPDAGPMRADVLMELGHAQCRVHRGAPTSPAYQDGLAWLRAAIVACDAEETADAWVPDLARLRSLRGKANARLARALELVPHEEHEALAAHRRALAAEPTNPYHLADVVGYERHCGDAGMSLESAAPMLRGALATCRDHVRAGTELPFSAFAAGRLSMLLDEPYAALGWYARGLRHLADGRSCVPPSVVDEEIERVRRLAPRGRPAPVAGRWVVRLLELARLAPPHAAPPGARGGTLVVAGGAASMDEPAALARVRPCLASLLGAAQGRVVSGGTRVGVPRLVADVAEQLAADGAKRFELVAYLPKRLPVDGPKDPRYDRFVSDAETEFSPGQILSMWEDLRKEGVSPASVTVVSFGGGPLSRVELEVATALGAATFPVRGSGGAADAILADDVWRGVSRLHGLPLDVASARAVLTPPGDAVGGADPDAPARAFHAQYLAGSVGRLPEPLRPWDRLPETYRDASRAQARDIVRILESRGFVVRPATGAADAIPSFADDVWRDEVEAMAELEHGRWNVDRLRAGWRYGRVRDDAAKVHPCIVPWDDLSEEIREYDRASVRVAPRILAAAGLEVVRRR
ncbi:MAG: hypothetical protein IT460_06140 [Planctomycetes bacterium]|nr:hypothetical protein [Planctomycetota bacterium]